ncbi:hypothetical protein BKA70DRAFT_1113535 [Coprinopsis sp. MPI-PUGE-AT-0042]|nr:hypothetical protein BKA70DRAFT_1113535 [Coprinopsis sp. MPI-PUGE-AT-0042]
MATQRIFLNQDIVNTIIDSYANIFDGSGLFQLLTQTISKKRRAMRQLCTLSRTFFEATSDHIWRNLSSIIPLFNLLPQSEQVEYVGFLTRSLKSEDLHRWKVYSHRVRIILIQTKNPGKGEPPYPSAQALAMFFAYRAATEELLFPALQHLTFRTKFKADELICLTALAPPSLKTLQLYCLRSSEVGLGTALRHATETITQLRRLTVRTDVHLESLWSILSRFTGLETINLTIPYAPNHVESFCSFPTLQAGLLLLSSGSPSAVSQEKPEACDLRCNVKSCPNGREIHLSGDLPSLVSAIPAAVQHGLTALEVASAETRLTGSSWEELLDVISISCSNISSLSLKDDRAAYSFPLGALWKLMALDNLQSLILRVDCNVQTTQDGPDQVFHRLCLSARHKTMPLTTLHIHRMSGEHLSLAALQHVSEHLPHLLDLKLAIDSSIHFDSPLGAHAEIPLARVPQGHPMKVLRLIDVRSGAFRPKEFRLIALLLDCLFPNLSSLEAIATGEAPFLGEGWRLIGDMRRDYQRLGKAIVNSTGAM